MTNKIGFFFRFYFIIFKSIFNWKIIIFNIVLVSAIHSMNKQKAYIGLLPLEPPSHLPPHPTPPGR